MHWKKWINAVSQGSIFFSCQMRKEPENNIGIPIPSQKGRCQHLRLTREESFRGFTLDSLPSEWERMRTSITWGVLKVRVHGEKVEGLWAVRRQPQSQTSVSRVRWVLEAGCECKLKGLHSKNNNLKGLSLECFQPCWGWESGSFSEIPRPLCRDLDAPSLEEYAGQSANSDTVWPLEATAGSDRILNVDMELNPLH